jgi:hypothetical protein
MKPSKSAPAPVHYPTYRRALEALPHIRAAASGELLTRIVPCPYGGFLIKQVPVDLHVDALLDGRPSAFTPIPYSDI